MTAQEISSGSFVIEGMSYNQEECSELSSFSEDDVKCPGPLYRVKVIVLGDHGSGKSSLVHSLIGEKPKLIDQSTEGVNLHIWYPFKNTSHGDLLDFPPTREQRHLVLEIWDLAGRQICQEVHPVYLSQGALYIIVYNSADDTSLDSICGTISTIQQKAPGSVILIVCSQTDKVLTAELDKVTTKTRNCLTCLQQSEDEIVASLKQHSSHVRSIGNADLIEDRIRQMDMVINKRTCLPTRTFNVSCISGKGLDEFRRELLNNALDVKLFPHLSRNLKQETINLYDEILQLRERGSVMITWKDFRNLLTDNLLDENELEEETSFLHTIGGLLDIRVPAFPESVICDRYICVHPHAFANSICALHLEDEKKQFKLEAKKFWPKESGFKKPDPSILVKSLEKILKHGLVREVLLPILWQDCCPNEDQIRSVLCVLVGLGVFVGTERAQGHCEGLALPNFRRLIVTNQYYLPLSDRLPDNRPQLHWTLKPFKGDIQVGWRYKFLSGVPPLLSKRLMAVCVSACSNIRYRHTWKYGILLRIDEVTMCFNEEGDHFDICCRANADDPGREEESVQLIWAELSPLLKSISVLLSAWPGILTEIFLMPLGHQLFGGEKVEGDPGLSLLECLVKWDKGEQSAFRDGENVRVVDLDLLFPFTDVEPFRSVNGFIDYLVATRDKILSTVKPKSSPAPRTGLGTTKIYTTPLRDKSIKKQRPEIKWNLKESKESLVPSRNLSVSQVSISRVSLSESPKPSPPPPPKTTESNPVTKTPTSPKNTKTSGVAQSDAAKEKSQDVGDSPSQVMMKPVLNEEDQIKEVTRVASMFVAAVMATAVAEYISAEFNDNHSSKKVATEAQVAAANMTAEAAMATHTGNIEGAGKAVMAAAKAMENLLTTSSSGIEKRGSTSKVCNLL